MLNPTASKDETLIPAYPQLLPNMSEEDYQALKADIAVHGLLVPIEIDPLTNEILDGWHRYRACQELGITLAPEQIHERTFAAEPERQWFCVSLNLYRRHLSQSQRAALIVEYQLPVERAKAKERMKLGGKQGGRGHRKERPAEKGGVILPPPFGNTGKVNEILGSKNRVSPTFITSARRLKEIAPERFANILQGKSSLSTEFRQIGLPTFKHGEYRKKKAPLDEKTFCENLLAEVQRRRKEAYATRQQMTWRPERLNALQLSGILDWIEVELTAGITTHAGIWKSRCVPQGRKTPAQE